MALMVHDGGGSGGGPGFDATSPYYNPGPISGVCTSLPSGPEGEGFWGAFTAGGGAVRGKIEAAMKAAHPDKLTAKAAVLDKAWSELNGHALAVSDIYTRLFSAWSGDDADQAKPIIGGLYATYIEQENNTGALSHGLKQMAGDLATCKKSWGHDASTLGSLGNWASGNQDDDAARDYQKMMTNFGTYLDGMPQHVRTQVKATAEPRTVIGGQLPIGTGPNGAPSMGGGGPGSHLGGPSNPHIGDPKLPDPTTIGQTHPPTNPPSIPTPPIHSPTLPTPGPAVHAGPITGGGGWPGTDGGNLPGLDTGTTLAGYDPSASGLGGGGLGAGGLGSGGLGAGGGAGTGLSGVGGAGIGAGSGAALGAGAGAAGGASGAGGGRGAMMAPMHGGGNGSEEERERSTWLNEDDDVWGSTDAPSGVIAD